ncbi:MAG: helix-turn-helix transcriptional regulator [Eubacterium sp.]|nr:helix-turn-helix transcriptional regulator [Eubacterium sp.]
MITYEPFWNTIKEKEISTYALIQKHNVSSATINRLRKNQGISTLTIDDLCKILKCRVEDILEYIED